MHVLGLWEEVEWRAWVEGMGECENSPRDLNSNTATHFFFLNVHKETAAPKMTYFTVY